MRVCAGPREFRLPTPFRHVRAQWDEGATPRTSEGRNGAAHPAVPGSTVEPMAADRAALPYGPRSTRVGMPRGSYPVRFGATRTRAGAPGPSRRRGTCDGVGPIRSSAAWTAPEPPPGKHRHSVGPAQRYDRRVTGIVARRSHSGATRRAHVVGVQPRTPATGLREGTDGPPLPALWMNA